MNVDAASSTILAPVVETPSETPRLLTIIEPPNGWNTLNLMELWRYRDLLFLLVWRDLSANYRQSILGFGWALFKPLCALGVYTLIFDKVVKLSSGDIPYPLFCYAGLLPWLYSSAGLSGSSQSVVNGGNLLTKVYFPRLLLPLASVLKPLPDFGIQFILLLILMACYHRPLGWGLLLTPVFLVLCAVAALALGLWLAALNAKYRDIGQLVPFLSQMWLWLTPVVYPSQLVPARWRLLYGLNPMVGVVEGFRWSLFGEPEDLDWTMPALSGCVVVVLFAGGLCYFRKVERTFADVI